MNGWYDNTAIDIIKTADRVATSNRSQRAIVAMQRHTDWILKNAQPTNGTRQYNVATFDQNYYTSRPIMPTVIKEMFDKGVRWGHAVQLTDAVAKIKAYNDLQDHTGKKVRQIFFDIEPWRTYSRTINGVSVPITWDYYVQTLKFARNFFPKGGLVTLLAYAGWFYDGDGNPKNGFTHQHLKDIITNCDEFNLHCYMQDNDNGGERLYSQARGRLELIADICQELGLTNPLQVNIKFSCEVDFSDLYYKSNPWNTIAGFNTAFDKNATVKMKQYIKPLFGQYMYATDEGKAIRP